jgi:predicted transcriptional regulator
LGLFCCASGTIRHFEAYATHTITQIGKESNEVRAFGLSTSRMEDIRNFRYVDRAMIKEEQEPLPDGTYDITFKRSTLWKQRMCDQLGLFATKGSVVANRSVAINIGCQTSDETFALLEEVEKYNIDQQTNAHRLQYDTKIAKQKLKRKEMIAKAKEKKTGKKKLGQQLKNSKMTAVFAQLAEDLEHWQAVDLPKGFFSALFTTIGDETTKSILQDILSSKRTVLEAIVYAQELKAQVFCFSSTSKVTIHITNMTYKTLPYLMCICFCRFIFSSGWRRRWSQHTSSC